MNENFGEAPSPSLCHLSGPLSLFIKKAVATAVAASGRHLELDSSCLSLCGEDLLWTKANLFTCSLVSSELLRRCLFAQAPVPALAALSSCPVILLRDAGTSSLVSSIYLVNLSPGTLFC